MTVAQDAADASASSSGMALFAHGFRPFFLLAGIWAVVPITVWAAALHGVRVPEGVLPFNLWHAHEMAAGFIGAAMCGFLLTAIPNWTGRRGYAGAPLMLVVTLFVLARVVLWPGFPVSSQTAAIIALLPLPALLLLIAPALIRAQAPRLLGPPLLILAFWIGDLLMLGDMAGWWSGYFDLGRMLALNVALALIGLIGGRILPSFTLNALRRAGRPADLQPLPGVDRAAIIALLLVVLGDLVVPGTPVSGAVAAVAAVLLLLRLSRWYGLRTLNQPILWVLHLAYLMLPFALGVKAVFLLSDWAGAANWLHLQTIGATALMILAVMTRATLGHTARDLVASRWTVAAYVMVPMAALLRGFGPIFINPQAAYSLSGLAWITAFAVFLIIFGPMLVTSRADGKPG